MRALRATTVGALMLSLVVVYGCERQPEGPDLREQVNESLERENLDHVTVDWDRDNNVVHLRGSVNSPAERQRAEQIANNAVGTTGTVLNELTVEGRDDEMAGDLDAGIRDRLNNLVENDQTLRERNIDFDVNNGMVKITGEVRTAAEKSRIEELAQNVPGVREVANALEVRQAQR
jgi:hyperosmotically inducible periplasmic protein